MFTLKHLKMLQHVSILFRSSSGSSYVPYPVWHISSNRKHIHTPNGRHVT